ncbi:MAG TPA: NAD(P)/FAD-dependent oxidoreductase [Solirubrobacterales bacterium]|nr:NAD(P)/FAD-dependent oxidoreductase [Solirubrobacterales bacterium]
MSERSRYDAVVVGARCAGSPLATRLAEQGWSVLLVDREPPPADTVSTHYVFPNTLARLRELGALERIEARHQLNPLHYSVRVLGNEIEGPFEPIAGFEGMCGITRPVLDQALLDVAIEAGAETRFGEKVTGLLGGGNDADPVRGVVLEGGEEIEARWVFGADGRTSTVAKLLGLPKEREIVGEVGIMYAYWRGAAESDRFRVEATEAGSLSWGQCEDDLSILMLGVPAEQTRGNAAQRQRFFVESLDGFEWFDPGSLAGAEQVSPIRVAPETMLRGFFRQATGPGWALVGDAGHFKHPSTAQGISDAIEQALHVADALSGAAEDLSGYEAWREDRAREHYEWSYDYARLPRPDVAGPVFAGLASDPEAGQDFRDSFCRLARPRSEVLNGERLGRWFGAVAAATA